MESCLFFFSLDFLSGLLRGPGSTRPCTRLSVFAKVWSLTKKLALKHVLTASQWLYVGDKLPTCRRQKVWNLLLDLYLHKQSFFGRKHGSDKSFFLPETCRWLISDKIEVIPALLRFVISDSNGQKSNLLVWCSNHCISDQTTRQTNELIFPHISLLRSTLYIRLHSVFYRKPAAVNSQLVDDRPLSVNLALTCHDDSASLHWGRFRSAEQHEDLVTACRRERRRASHSDFPVFMWWNHYHKMR